MGFNQTIKLFCTFLLFLLISIVFFSSSSSCHIVIRPATPATEVTQYQEFHIKNTTPFILDKEPYKKRTKKRKMMVKKRKEMIKNFKTRFSFLREACRIHHEMFVTSTRKFDLEGTIYVGNSLCTIEYWRENKIK
ncbi:hypothetical protein OIU76_029830 [Salix suchowensis]|uniref:Uncharacterized protein n=1 Tax=Salix suchowensis TaxID=1278906 RepID=A0ABQ9CCT6_9ROSI|nr:hypothetical protein OIU76_029830 [Salix suchowensis]KAJ6396088.1 hypothetical protein OIU77_021180 [Salix suchowensis]